MEGEVLKAARRDPNSKPNLTSISKLLANSHFLGVIYSPNKQNQNLFVTLKCACWFYVVLSKFTRNNIYPTTNIIRQSLGAFTGISANADPH